MEVPRGLFLRRLRVKALILKGLLAVPRRAREVVTGLELRAGVAGEVKAVVGRLLKRGPSAVHEDVFRFRLATALRLRPPLSGVRLGRTWFWRRA